MGDFLGTYDPTQVSVILGTYTVTGFADGTFVKVAKADKELYKSHIGAHGEVARTKNPNKSGTITFTLKATSPSNKILDAMKNNPITIPAFVKDNSDSKFIASAVNSWISVDPDDERSAEESNIEWVVACAELLKSNL